MFVQRVYHPVLAQASYVIGCQATGEAVVIDPHRAVEEYEAIAQREGFRITAVTETHIHADFVSGAHELALRNKATLYLSDAGPAEWAYHLNPAIKTHLLNNGDSFWIGNVRIQAQHTPGHTPEHIAFLITDTPALDTPLAIVTGDSVFVGDVGRPDLLEKAVGMVGSTEAGARQLFHSIQWFKSLPDYLQIWPGHGAGSACGRALGAVPSSTIGYEQRVNWAFQIPTEETFITAVLEGQPAPPPYFAQMKRINKVGAPLRPTTLPPALSLEALVALREHNAQLLDLRTPEQFAQRHIQGSINLPLGDSMLTWAGWLVSYERPIVLIVDHADLTSAQATFGLIGLDTIVGAADPALVDAWAAQELPMSQITHRSVSMVAESLSKPLWTLLDVRTAAEYAAGHLPLSRNLPLAELNERLSSIPQDRPVLVYCQAGGRSPIAASLFTAHGFPNVAEMRDGFAGWEAANQPIER